MGGLEMTEEQPQQPEKRKMRVIWAFPIFLMGMCTGAFWLLVFLIIVAWPEGNDIDSSATEVAIVEPTEMPTDTLIPEPTEMPTDTLIPEPTEMPTDTLLPESTATSEVLPTDTAIPEPTTWVVVINCPDCEGLPLTLWENIGDIGTSPGKVNHGDTCIVLDQGVTEGIEKYKLDCSGMIGWLRSEAVKPAE
jgi:hypothetical protein